MSLVEFTKSLYCTDSRPDVKFLFKIKSEFVTKEEDEDDFGQAYFNLLMKFFIKYAPKILTKEEAVSEGHPLFAHSHVLAHYSPKFKAMFANFRNDECMTISIESDRAPFEAMIKGIYWGFTDVVSTEKATKDLFDLVRDYDISRSISDNLFTAENLWSCLEHVLHHPRRDIITLHKCNKMLSSNKSVYRVIMDGQDISYEVLTHVLTLPQSPLSLEDKSDLVMSWSKSHPNMVDLNESFGCLGVTIMESEDPVIHVTSSHFAPFTIKFDVNYPLSHIQDKVQCITKRNKFNIALKFKDLRIKAEDNCKMGDIGLYDGATISVSLIVSIKFLSEKYGIDKKVTVAVTTKIHDLKKMVVDKWMPSCQSFDPETVQLFKTLGNETIEELNDAMTVEDSGLEDEHVIVIDTLPCSNDELNDAMSLDHSELMNFDLPDDIAVVADSEGLKAALSVPIQPCLVASKIPKLVVSKVATAARND